MVSVRTAHKPLPNPTHQGMNGTVHDRETVMPTTAHSHQRGQEAVCDRTDGLKESGPFMISSQE